MKIKFLPQDVEVEVEANALMGPEGKALPLIESVIDRQYRFSYQKVYYKLI